MSSINIILNAIRVDNEMLILQYKNGTGTGWDVSSASFVGSTLTFDAPFGSSYSLFMHSSGTRMFVSGQANAGKNDPGIAEYTLSTPFDITTMGLTHVNSFLSNPPEHSPRGLDFTSDGLRVYLIGFQELLYTAPLSVAWDVSTIGSLTSMGSVGSEFTGGGGQPYGVQVSSDGTKAFVSGTVPSAPDIVAEYSISPAYTGTISFTTSLNVSAHLSSPLDLRISPNGTYLFVTGPPNADVARWSMSTPWDLSTASDDNNTFEADAQITGGFSRGITFNPNGTKMYLIEINRRIYEYDL